MILGLIICYTAGTAWFVITYTKNISVFGALKSCVIPFIIPDLLKMSFAVLVSERLKKSIKKQNSADLICTVFISINLIQLNWK